MSYDSRIDTYEHIAKVRRYLFDIIVKLLHRADGHDLSKLHSPEREMFDEFTPRLQNLTYGSAEYKAALREMGNALEHHYKHNPHHPEHHPFGIDGMSLLDLLEMLVDWKAASERVGRPPMPAAPDRPGAPQYNDDFMRSIKLNQQRFGYGDQVRMILENTARELGFT